ncbi:MAG: nucleotidyltransferase domain-containing protein [Candidatus Pacearchaeota archaeon]|nr:nucleotidyltransferase domain-containing protein [Candidatus Pacearchaeota archaeon]
MIKPKMSNITQKGVNLGGRLGMLMPFTSDYSVKLSASEIARRTKIPQQSTSRYLNKFVNDSLLEYKKEGRNKLFYLDLKKETSRIMLNLIETEKALGFQMINKEVSVIINDLLKYCEGIIIFGSYASGNFNEDSDLDIVIFEDTSKGKIKKIKRKSGLDIVEHYVSYKEFEEILLSNNPLAIEILNNHVLFGNLSKIVNIFLKKVKR